MRYSEKQKRHVKWFTPIEGECTKGLPGLLRIALSDRDLKPFVAPEGAARRLIKCLK